MRLGRLRCAGKAFAHFAAFDPVGTGITQGGLLSRDLDRRCNDAIAMPLVLQQRRQAHAVTNLDIAWISKGGNDFVRELRELQEVVKVLLGDREPVSHLRPDTAIIGIDGMTVVARAFEIGDILPFAVFKVR